MKKSIQILLVASSLLGGVSHLHAQGTAFTYQGSLHVNGGAASGSYDFRFRVASDALGNNYVSGPVLAAGVPANNGLFVVTLDFGAGVFTGGNLWLQVEVKTNGAAGYTTLVPLQAITATPYAIMASNAINSSTASNLTGTLPATQLSGIVPEARLAGNVARTNQVWLLGGNAGTSSGTHFLGTTDNQSLELRVNGTRALRLDPNPTSPNVIGGHVSNSVSPGIYGATIAGGGRDGSVHTISAHHGTISGGDLNTVNGEDGTIAGGSANFVAGKYASVVGGHSNTIQYYAEAATIGGGYQNTIQTNAFISTIGGGYLNTILSNATYATIGGGVVNTIQDSAHKSTISGGYQNTIQPNADSATIGGGYINTIQSYGSFATIAGGYENSIQLIAWLSTIGGGYHNAIQYNASAATIGGGYYNTIQSSSASATIGGGYGNVIQTSSGYVTIGGGYYNTIQNNAGYATIGGGNANTIQASDSGNDSYATIPGGGANTIQFNAFEATIGGGYHNTIETNAERATIGGGYYNTIQTNAHSATLSGGHQNTIQPNAGYATISGGHQNTIQPNASYAIITNATFATIGGGSLNTIQPNAVLATIPGGYSNSAASYAFAAGRRAKANHTGAFVWADSQDADFSSSSNNQFNIRAAGGVRFSDSTPQISFGQTTRQMITLYDSGLNSTFGIGVQGSTFYQRAGTGSGFAWFCGGTHTNAPNNAGGGTVLMRLDANGNLTIAGTYSPSSDRNVKTNFASVSAREILEKVTSLPISNWAYQQDAGTKHIGPMAQDFYAAFGLGTDDKHIATVDADGVALAAIQGLNQKVEVQGLELKLKQAEITELKARLEKIEQRMNRSGQ